MSALAPTMQAFFTDRLTKQRNASQHTIAAYRDTMRLLLAFASERSAKPPSALDISDLNARSSARSSITSSTSAPTASAPATRVWQRSARCSATPRSDTLSTPPRSRGSSRSRPNASNERW